MLTYEGARPGGSFAGVGGGVVGSTGPAVRPNGLAEG
jgi:hypothetical protein